MYVCPSCNSKIEKFLPLPEYYRDRGCIYPLESAETLNYANYLCPVCNASDRDRLSIMTMARYFKSIGTVNLSFVQYAPTPAISNFIRTNYPQFVYRTSDITGDGIDDYQDIMHQTLYGDNSIDFFICSHVLEHVPDDRQAMSELYRILKPKACGIIMVPIVLGIDKIDEEIGPLSEAERWRRFGQDNHLRIYSKSGFIERLVTTGFYVHQLGEDFFGSNAYERHAITSQSVCYLVQKS